LAFVLPGIIAASYIVFHRVMFSYPWFMYLKGYFTFGKMNVYFKWVIYVEEM